MNMFLSASRVAFGVLALGAASATTTFAQITNTPTATAPACTAGECHRHHHTSVLTADEKAELKKAYDVAIAANPALKTEQDNLRRQFETLKSEGKGVASKDQWQTLRQQEHDFHVKLKSAELAVDPSLTSIFAKLEAAHKDRHHFESE